MKVAFVVLSVFLFALIYQNCGQPEAGTVSPSTNAEGGDDFGGGTDTGDTTGVKPEPPHSVILNCPGPPVAAGNTTCTVTITGTTYIIQWSVYGTVRRDCENKLTCVIPTPTPGIYDTLVQVVFQDSDQIDKQVTIRIGP